VGTQEQLGLVQAYGDATVRLRDALGRAIDAHWIELGSWREEDIPRFLARVLPLVNGSVAAMVTMTDAYLGAVLTDMLGGPSFGAGASRPTYPRPGVTPAEVYRRPFQTTWTALSKGAQVSQAIQSGRSRAVSLATTDLQLAKRNASTARLVKEPRVVGYRRVLMGSKSCAMCALASTQRYRKERLMPVHPGCNCGVAPLVGTADPGQRINAAKARDQAALDTGDLDELGDTDALHAAISQRFGFDAVDFRGQTYGDLVVTHQHGELGEVLARKGDRFTGPDDI
jgi:hypothetical protein